MALTTAGTSTWKLLYARHQVQLITEELSTWLGNLGVALQKKEAKRHILALLIPALHQLYTRKHA